MRCHGRRGFVLITMLFSVVVLVAFLGLAVDTAYMELVKTRMQTAADAAALGGAQEIKLNGAANVETSARSDAALNGFTHGVDGVAVTVYNPPSTGYSTGDSTGVEVVITRRVNSLFLGVAGSAAVNVSARAVARQGPGASCLHVLDPGANAAFSASGGANVKIDCGVVVESSHETAFSVSGGTTVKATSFSIFGGKSVVGGSTATPTPSTGVKGPGDPLAYLTPPPVGGCDFTNLSIGGGLTRTLAPAVYCGGITLSNGSNITFLPSPTVPYILKGGGLDIGGGVTAHGAGVTFYNTAGGGYAFKPFNFHNGANVNFSAPTSGPFAGILFFQDRTIVSALVNNFIGGTNVLLNGSLYLPTTAVLYSGGTDVAGTYSIIVAKTIVFQGGCKMHNDYSALPNGSPIRGSALVSE